MPYRDAQPLAVWIVEWKDGRRQVTLVGPGGFSHWQLREDGEYERGQAYDLTVLIDATAERREF